MKMTINEAISFWLKAAEDNEAATKWKGISNVLKQRCIKQAVEYRQLAEWLTEYKELKNSIDAVKLSNMEEALELIRKYKVENIAQKKLIAEYKRLLKSATGIIKDIDCNEDYLCDECEYRAKCDGGFSFYWHYADEALKLIES